MPPSQLPDRRRKPYQPKIGFAASTRFISMNLENVTHQNHDGDNL